LSTTPGNSFSPYYLTKSIIPDWTSFTPPGPFIVGAGMSVVDNGACGVNAAIAFSTCVIFLKSKKNTNEMREKKTRLFFIFYKTNNERKCKRRRYNRNITISEFNYS
jgi:hypothetical protein